MLNNKHKQGQEPNKEKKQGQMTCEQQARAKQQDGRRLPESRMSILRAARNNEIQQCASVSRVRSSVAERLVAANVVEATSGKKQGRS